MISSLIPIELIEAIKANDLETVKEKVELFNTTFKFPNEENIGFFDVLPLRIFAYTLEDGYTNQSLHYVLDNIIGISSKAVEEIKWNLKINTLKGIDETKNFINYMLTNENEWINKDYKIYSLIRLITINQDYDSLSIMKQKLLNKGDN